MIIIQLTKLLKPNFKQGEKIAIVLNNENKEFRKRNSPDDVSQEWIDEIEATDSTAVGSLRNWIIKNYVCIDYLTRSILEDYKSEVNSDIDVIRNK